MTEPLMRRLAARGERLTVGALPWVAPVYRAMPHVAEVIDFPFQHGGLQFKARRAMARQLRGQFDIAYVLPNSAKSALLPFLAGIRRRVGYMGEMRLGLLTQRLRNPPRDERPPMVGFYSALSGERGIETDRPQLQLPAAQIEAVLLAQGLAHRGFHVFAPGAEFGPSKRWPPEHYAQLASGLALPVLLLGSGKEHALCEQIAAAANARSPGRCINLAGQTALADAFCLIAAAHSVVSNDSGLMHVAAAFGTPQVAVYGSTSPEHTPPLSDAATVLWLKRDAAYQPPLDCAPCFQRTCPLGHNRCMVDIPPARVAAVLATIA
ncbi:lipopolysaccharide heptosyltransferase [Pseudorhodoferax sp. Leaf274]|nr:lipopolysaccharide heptosyltransferase [Pseudorhodoferax sp. Leaf274]